MTRSMILTSLGLPPAGVPKTATGSSRSQLQWHGGEVDVDDNMINGDSQVNVRSLLLIKHRLIAPPENAANTREKPAYRMENTCDSAVR